MSERRRIAATRRVPIGDEIPIDNEDKEVQYSRDRNEVRSRVRDRNEVRSSGPDERRQERDGNEVIEKETDIARRPGEAVVLSRSENIMTESPILRASLGEIILAFVFVWLLIDYWKSAIDSLLFGTFGLRKNSPIELLVIAVVLTVIVILFTTSSSEIEKSVRGQFGSFQ